MRFWDASALVPLALEDPRSASLRAVLREDGEVAAWWGTAVECASAVARFRREGRVDVDGESTTLGLIDRLRAAWLEVEPSELVRRGAIRLLRVHALRAGDALQLSAGLAWAGTETGREFVTLDHRLADAARKEGFNVLGPVV